MLGGGFKDFLFSPLFGEDSHFDYSNILQRGWNHQLEWRCGNQMTFLSQLGWHFVGFQPWVFRGSKGITPTQMMWRHSCRSVAPVLLKKKGGEEEDRGNEGEHIPLAKWEPTTITSISTGYNHILGRISWNGHKGFVSVVGSLSRRSNNLAFPPGLQTRDEASATWPCRTVSVVGRWHNKQPFGPGYWWQTRPFLFF